MISGTPSLITNGLVFYVDAFNKLSYTGNGTSWNDLSSNNNTGSLVNGPVFNNSDGGVITFDGTNDYVIATRPSSIINSGSISVSIWAKWTTKEWTGNYDTSIQALVDNNHRAPPAKGFIIQDRPDLSKKLTWGPLTDSNGKIFTTSSFIVGDNKWHHIVGTNDGTSSILYIDGRTDSVVLQPPLLLVQPDVSIGCWQNDGPPARFLNGSIAQVMIYNRALSASEVLQNYNAYKGRFGLS